MQRSRRYQPLSSQPLILVLCQLRFSPVRQMNRYTPAIQDAFRRTGFPIERAGKVRQVTFTPSGSAPVQMVEQQRWEYRNREETWSVLVTQDSVILQTTAYTRFERFAERLQSAVNTVLTESEEYRTRSSSLDDTSCTSRAEARRWGGGGGLRIPTIPITSSAMPITDSGGFRSPWRRAEVHRGAGVGLRV